MMALRTCAALLLLTAQSPDTAIDFDTGTVAATVHAVADLVNREYADAAAAPRIADALRRRLDNGEFASITTPQALATALTRDLVADSHDLHLAVNVARVPAAGAPANRQSDARAEAVRQSNGGVQQVEIFPGNIGIST